MNPTILTWSGRYFSLVEPCASEVRVQDIAIALSHICRFGGHVREFYSVAQHSVAVSYAVPEALALEGLLHDAAEAYLGDIVKPLKVLLPDYVELERRVDMAIRDRFRLPAVPSAEIKVADVRLLATERRDLMPANDHEWSILKDVEPLPQIIYPFCPVNAAEMFLVRFWELCSDEELWA